MTTTCPKCAAELKAKVVTDQFDGEMNMLFCSKDGYTVAVSQPSRFEVDRYRAGVARLALAIEVGEIQFREAA